MSSEVFWNKSSFEVAISGNTARATKDFKRALSAEDDRDLCSPTRGVNSRSTTPLFPWICPTAVSEKTFEDGLHEFVLEVGSGGNLGFCDASFVNEPTRLFEHWVRTENKGRVWVLQSCGFFVTPESCTHVPDSKFSRGDRIKIVLDLFEERATLTRIIGSSSYPLCMMERVDRPVRLGFQMFRAGDAISLLSLRDVTDSMPSHARAAAWLRRATTLLARAADAPADKPDSARLAFRRRLLARAHQAAIESARLFATPSHPPPNDPPPNAAAAAAAAPMAESAAGAGAAKAGDAVRAAEAAMAALESEQAGDPAGPEA